jgi:hypothetical protein
MPIPTAAKTNPKPRREKAETRTPPQASGRQRYRR